MNKSIDKCWVLLLVVLLGACAARRTVYQPPVTDVPEPPAASAQQDEAATLGGKSIVVGARDAAWQRLLARAKAERFAIEKTDQQAGRVLLRYSGDPMPHVDCGTITTKVVRAEGEAAYTFPGALAQQNYEINRAGAVYSVDRRMSLDAQVEVNFKALDARRTRVVVGSMYRLKRDQRVQGKSGGKPLEFSDVIGFSSAGNATFANAATRCEATGRLEQKVLDWLQAAR